MPKTSQWNLIIRWLEADGAFVTKGQKIAEFDNSAFASNLADQKLAATDAENQLAYQIAQNGIIEADKRFEVDTARTALEKARLEASVAPDTLPMRVYQDRQLELKRTQALLAKATDELEAHIESAKHDIKVRTIAIEKARREIELPRPPSVRSSSLRHGTGSSFSPIIPGKAESSKLATTFGSGFLSCDCPISRR